MTEKAKKYEAEMLKAIKEHNLMRFDHVFGGFVSFSSSTAYNHELEKLESIKEALFANRRKDANNLIQKWINSDNATLQIAAMRLIGDEDERRKLNQQYVQQTQTIRHQVDPFEKMRENAGIKDERANDKAEGSV